MFFIKYKESLHFFKPKNLESKGAAYTVQKPNFIIPIKLQPDVAHRLTNNEFCNNLCFFLLFIYIIHIIHMRTLNDVA